MELTKLEVELKAATENITINVLIDIALNNKRIYQLLLREEKTKATVLKAIKRVKLERLVFGNDEKTSGSGIIARILRLF